MDINNLDAVAKAIRCPAVNVKSNWPSLQQCLASFPEYTDKVAIAALATVSVETANTFKPIHEFGSKDYFIRHYDGRKDLGNTHAGDGYVFRGRGYIQITGEINYEKYGKLLGINLEDNPENACDPIVAACILTAYFHDRKVYEAANATDWRLVRKRVNGGLNGWGEFIACVNRLQA